MAIQIRDYRRGEQRGQWFARLLPGGRLEIRTMTQVTVCDLTDIEIGVTNAGLLYVVLPATGAMITDPFWSSS